MSNAHTRKNKMQPAHFHLPTFTEQVNSITRVSIMSAYSRDYALCITLPLKYLFLKFFISHNFNF